MAKEPASAAPSGAEPKKKSKVMGFLKTLLGSAAMAGAGFGGGFFYFANPLSPAQDMLRLIEPQPEGAAGEHAEEGDEEEGEAVPKKVPKPLPEHEAFVTSYYSFPDALTSNLKESRRFLQITVGVSTQYDAQVITNVTTHTPALMSDMLAVMSTFTEADLDGTEGRAKLAEALKAAINARLEKAEGFGGVEDVFFPSFMMQ